MFALLVLLGVLTPGITASELHLQGVSFYRSQQFQKAIDCLQQAIQSEEPKSTAYVESALIIGQSYFMLSAAPQAIPWLEKVPGVNEGNYMLGYAYLQARQPAASVAAFARLFHVDPESPSAHLMAGQMMLKREFEAEALTEIDRALQLDPKLPQAHYLKGEIEIRRGLLPDALIDLNAELRLDPNFSMAWYRLGDAYGRQNKWIDAIPNLQRAIWLNPEFSGPFILLGRAYLKTGDLRNAEGILKRSLVLDPKNTSALYTLAQTLSAENKSDEAHIVLERLKAAKESNK